MLYNKIDFNWGEKMMLHYGSIHSWRMSFSYVNLVVVFASWIIVSCFSVYVNFSVYICEYFFLLDFSSH